MYLALCEDIDRRYKIEFGTLELKGRSKDDPMGLSELRDEEKAEEEPEERADLDAMKGKGKGKGDGKCHKCLGEGHFARDCPSIEPIGPQST